MSRRSTDGDRHGATWKQRRAVPPGNRWGRLLGWLGVALRIATLIVWAQVVGRATQAIIDSSDSGVATRPGTYHGVSTTLRHSH